MRLLALARKSAGFYHCWRFECRVFGQEGECILVVHNSHGFPSFQIPGSLRKDHETQGWTILETNSMSRKYGRLHIQYQELRPFSGRRSPESVLPHRSDLFESVEAQPDRRKWSVLRRGGQVALLRLINLRARNISPRVWIQAKPPRSWHLKAGSPV